MPKTLMQFVQKYAQFVRFVIAGSTAFAVNIVALYFFTEFLGIYYLFSTILAFFVALTVSFTLQKFWTFQDASRDRLHVQIPVYASMQFMNVTLNVALMYVFVEYLHIWYLFSQVIISLSLALVVFFVNKFYIFKKREITSVNSADDVGVAELL